MIKDQRAEIKDQRSNLGVGGLGASGVLLLAQTTLAVQVTQGGEGLVVVAAHLRVR